jgi:protein-disulfide isomerase
MEENIDPVPAPSAERPAAGKDNPSVIAGAIIVAGLLIAGAIFLKDRPAPTSAPGEPRETPPQLVFRPISKDEHILGNPNARLVIVEYSDTECPFCKAFHATMHRVIETRGQDVAWVYRHYPIPQLHRKAFREAEATECAWQQGGNDAFWKFTDRIFETTPSNDGLPDSELPRIAGGLGLDVATFNACLEGGRMGEKVRADMEDGNRIGVRGTPSSFILLDGEVVDTIPGALPFEAVNQKIDQALR